MDWLSEDALPHPLDEPEPFFVDDERFMVVGLNPGRVSIACPRERQVRHRAPATELARHVRAVHRGAEALPVSSPSIRSATRASASPPARLIQARSSMRVPRGLVTEKRLGPSCLMSPPASWRDARRSPAPFRDL